ncbi:MAG: hypothetical protein HY208_00535 [Nitrospirae bacterium]|nr:hypothetical protein [Nitrospirota bacterium]
MIAPRLKILALIALAVAAFLIRDPWLLGGLFTLLLGAWAALRLPAGLLFRLVRKLSFFVVMILLAFAFFPSENIQGGAGQQIALPGTSIMISLTGLLLGGLMALRMLIVIIASQLVQLTSKPGEFVAGLRGLMMPEVVALTIDSTLYLLGPQGGKQGRGSGMGGGRSRGQGAETIGAPNAAEAKEPGFFSVFNVKRIKSGDFGFLIELIEQGLARSRAYIGSQQGDHSRVKPTVLHDVSIISGLCLLMLTAKLLKVMPGIPFAPGYKITFLVPLYILAAELTHTRFGATITGTTVGIISFLFGDGRFGIFEILKHITPGLVVDLFAPLTRQWMKKPSTVTFIILGALCAFTRSTTMLAVVFFIEGNALLYAMVGFQAVSQVFFGALSGFVTFYLVKSLGRLKTAAGLAPAGPGELPGGTSFNKQGPSTTPLIEASTVDQPAEGGRGDGAGRGGGRGGGRGRGGGGSGQSQEMKQPLINTK